MGCMVINGHVVNISHVWAPEPTDFLSSLIRRSATAIDLGADKSAVLEVCLNEGQTHQQAELTYLAALILSNHRQEDNHGV
jgi:hypothetical protein